MNCFGFYGIDKIKIALNPLFFNVALFNSKKYIDPKNRLTLHRSGQFYSLCIHAEYFKNPQNIYLDIWQAISDLFFNGYFIVPSINCIGSFYFPFIPYFALFIQQVEFFYDFPEECIHFGPDDELRDTFIRKKTTLYSQDYKKNKRKSIVCIYNRKEKRLKNNNENHKNIEASRHDYRLEFRLTRDNCEYLHFDNLEGSFQEIHNRYAPYLGIVFSNHVGHAVIFDHGCDSEEQTQDGTHNEGFHQVNRYSELNRTRYTGDLKKSQPYINIKISEIEKSIIAQDIKARKTRNEPADLKLA